MSDDWQTFYATLAPVAVTAFSVMFLSLQVKSQVWRGRILLHVSAVAALAELFVVLVAALIISMAGRPWEWAAWIAGGGGLVVVIVHWWFYLRELMRERRGGPPILKFERTQARVAVMSLIVYSGIFVSPWLPNRWSVYLLAGLLVWLLFSGAYEAWWLLEPKGVSPARSGPASNDYVTAPDREVVTRRTVSADLARFTAAGAGTVHGAAAEGLAAGQLVAVTDEGSDVLEGQVVCVRDGAADVLVRWDRVLRRVAG